MDAVDAIRIHDYDDDDDHYNNNNNNSQSSRIKTSNFNITN